MNYAEVACGAGGLGDGLHKAGFRCAGAWDLDEDAVKTYRKNVSTRATVLDISKLSLERDDFDLLTCGLPCETFSTLGRMDSTDRRARLWWQFARLLEESRVTTFMIENVVPFLRTRRFRLLVSRAENLGYGVGSVILDARAFGVAQIRKRAFIIGSLNGLTLFDGFEPNGATVRMAIGDLPLEPDGRNAHEGYAHREASVARYSLVPPGGDWRDIPRSLWCPCWRDVEHGARGVLGRLDWDEPAETIRTAFLKPETGRYIHPEADRGLTIREGARLQGFDDSFRFSHGSLDDKSRMIGRAVPPPMAEGIGRIIRETL